MPMDTRNTNYKLFGGLVIAIKESRKKETTLFFRVHLGNTATLLYCTETSYCCSRIWYNSVD